MSEAEVTVFDWPSRFLVSTPNRDSEWPKFFKGLEDFAPFAPYLVDLEDGEHGRCGCRDYAVNVEPYLNDPSHRKECSHLIAARRWKSRNPERPRSMPAVLTFR